MSSTVKRTKKEAGASASVAAEESSTRALVEKMKKIKQVTDEPVTKKVVSKAEDVPAEGAEVAEAVVEEDPDKAILQIDESISFRSLGLSDVLCEACEKAGYKAPSEIQRESLPYTLVGRDIIGLAQTGSGKTAAFVLPVLHKILETPRGYFACVVAPTRELAFQISEQFDLLGRTIGLKTCVLVGGMDVTGQAIALGKKPHVIIATPGRLVWHLENTKGFTLNFIKFLILDEADRLLNMDFEDEIDKILSFSPTERSTYLFSATMTSKVAKLQRACLRNPVKVEVSSKYSTVDTLMQYYTFIPAKYKDVYLAYILNELSGSTVLVFTTTCNSALRLSLMLRNLGFLAIPIYGKMNQEKRLGALGKFKSGVRNILVATDVASRGLDIPSVDVVINYELSSQTKEYIHRVGRTARAGRSGKAITFVTQYDVELFQRVESLVGKKMDAFPTVEDEVLSLQERVSEAQRYATTQMKEFERQKRGHGDDDDDFDPRAPANDRDDEEGDVFESSSGGKKRKKFRDDRKGGPSHKKKRS